MQVIFSHGKESGPWGSKITTLAKIAQHHGHQVDSLDYSAIANPDARVEKLIGRLAEVTEPVLLVGSSMGGYVSLVACERHPCAGVFLLAPALFMPGYDKQSYSSGKQPICIVHGKEDEVIPYQHSEKYAAQSGCELHLITGDHRLNSSMDQVTRLYTDFLKRF